MMTPALILSLLLASTFLVMVRLKAPRWTYLVLGLLPTAVPLLMSPALRVYGYHGFVQAGIVYQLLQGHIPPSSPLLAGQPGTYPWAGALILAGISKAFGISPFWAAFLVAIAALAALLVLTYRIGLLLTGDAEASLFGVAASLYAFSFTQSVPDNAMKSALSSILPFPYVEPRGAPLLEKFNGCTAFPLGLALYAVALLLLLRLARDRSPSIPDIAALAASLVALAFIYPYFLPPMALLCVIASILAWRAGGPARRLAVMQVGVLALVGLLALPYYLQLRAGRTGSVLQLVPLSGLVRQAGVVVVTFLPMALLLFFTRRAVKEKLRAHGRVATLMLTSVAMNLVLFAFFLAPLWSQYKFLLLGVFALGIVGGVGFRTLQQRSWPVALAVLTLFLLPFGLDCVHKATDWNDAPREFRESGTVLDHLDPAQSELYQWVRTQTDPRAVFVDSELGMPVFGQRALYVTVPPQKEVKELTTQGGDGYALDLRIILKTVDGYPEELVDRRLEIAERLLSGSPSAGDLADVAAAGPAVYLILRPGSEGVARPAQPDLPVVYKSSAATVLLLPSARR